MKRFATTILAAAALAACFDDPTSDLRGGPATIRLSRTAVFLAPQETTVVTGTLLDAQGNPVPGTVSFSSDDAAIATATDLPEDTLPGQLQSSAMIVAVGPGTTFVRVTGGGLNDSMAVTVVPTAFDGTVAPATTTVGTEIVITATPLMTFDPAAVGVQVDGIDAFITSATASEIRFIASIASGATVSISGLIFLGTIELPALDATTSITVTDPSEPANDAPGGGATIALPTTTGGSVVQFASIDANDVDDYFTITTTTGDSLEIVLDWLNDAIDIDMYVLDAAGGGFCVLDNCSAGTGSDPEVARVRLAPGTTYNIYINLFDDHGEATPIPYRITITKRG